MLRRLAILVLMVGGCSASPTPPPMAPWIPVRVEGSGIMNTAPFQLEAGDYIISWSAADRSKGDRVGCSHGAALHPVSGKGGELLVNAGVEADGTKSGVTHVYGATAGSYYIRASSGCDWQFDISR